MTLDSIERGIEYADKNKVLVLAPTQIVLVMLVEDINVTGLDWKYIAVHVFDFAFSGNAITGLKVIAIFQQRLAPGLHDRMANREPHSIPGRQEPMTRPVAPIHEVFTSLYFSKITHEHH
jgi:hypothetical protein